MLRAEDHSLENPAPATPSCLRLHSLVSRKKPSTFPGFLSGAPLKQEDHGGVVDIYPNSFPGFLSGAPLKLIPLVRSGQGRAGGEDRVVTQGRKGQILLLNLHGSDRLHGLPDFVLERNVSLAALGATDDRLDGVVSAAKQEVVRRLVVDILNARALAGPQVVQAQSLPLVNAADVVGSVIRRIARQKLIPHKAVLVRVIGDGDVLHRLGDVERTVEQAHTGFSVGGGCPAESSYPTIWRLPPSMVTLFDADATDH